MNVRLADERELNRINELRKQLLLHDSVCDIWKDPEQDIAVAELDGEVLGYAILHHIIFAETPAMLERDFLNVDEICVDEAFRGQGIAKDMLGFIREYAVKKGFRRVELCVWEFNRNALAVYEAAGFHPYKHSMEIIF